MSTDAKLKPPKRLRLKPHCFVEGVRLVDGQPRLLAPGLYVLGKNMTEAEAMRLAQPDMAHAVEILEDRRPDEDLASDVPAPEPTPGYVYEKQKFAAEMQAKIDLEVERQKARQAQLKEVK